MNNEINLLIIGGSQGAKLFDIELKSSLLRISKKYKLNIYQQANKSNFRKLKDFYEKNSINYSSFYEVNDIYANIMNSDAVSSAIKERVNKIHEFYSNK